MENILAKKEKVDFCTEEFNKKAKDILEDLAGVSDDRSHYKQQYPFEYKQHVEINHQILKHHIDLMIEHLKYMKEKIKHDETFISKR